MTAGTLIETTRPRRVGDGSLRRIASLARAEALLLRRNPSALFTALLGPASFVLIPVLNSATRGAETAAMVVTGLLTFSLVFVVYYNLVTALVARREELVLKRLRTGELSDAEIIAGAAAPAVAIAAGQVLIGTLLAAALLGMAVPANLLLVGAAAALGTAACVLLAAATTALTRTVETAQLTATPMFLVSAILSGVLVPLDMLPEPVARVAHGLPVTAVVDLLRLGLTGRTAGGALVDTGATFAPAAVPLLVLTGWVIIGAWASRRWFRWEPRR